ncbi:MAG TPA: hypothetical protein VGC88_01725 [Terriglobales bacterium]
MSTRVAIAVVMVFGLQALMVAQDSNADAARAKTRRVLEVPSEEHRAEAKFQSGGRVKLDLGVGDFKVVPGSSDRVVVTWRGRTAGRCSASATASGTMATVSTTCPKSGNNDVTFTVEVPPQSDISGHASVGDLTVGPFDGNVDLGLGVGDFKVRVSNADDYAEVDASTSIGDVNGGPFEAKQHGFLGKTIHWTGNGRHRLKLHVGTGDLNIEKGEATM